MTTFRIAWLGDVVGRPGRAAVAHAVPRLRAEGADLILANAENARHGRGLHPEGYDELRAAGVDAITLGDHTLDDERILGLLQDPEAPIAKPVNIEQWPSAKDRLRLHSDAPIFVITVLGRLFMRLEGRPPFDAIDDALAQITGESPDALVLLEVHAEATSEKLAILWHCHERWSNHVVAVVGSHTHVQTSDARLIDDRLAAITDLGMCGGRRSVIGFGAQASIERFRGTRRTPLDVVEEEPVAEGCLITLDTRLGRAARIRPFRIECP